MGQGKPPGEPHRQIRIAEPIDKFMYKQLFKYYLNAQDFPRLHYNQLLDHREHLVEKIKISYEFARLTDKIDLVFLSNNKARYQY